MKHLHPALQHNYLTKIHGMWESGALPREAGYHQLDVAHDDWCGFFQKQRCNCDPAIRLKYSLAGNSN
jgi:hypothetical protein